VQLYHPKSTTIKPADPRYERGTTGGHVTQLTCRPGHGPRPARPRSTGHAGKNACAQLVQPRPYHAGSGDETFSDIGPRTMIRRQAGEVLSPPQPAFSPERRSADATLGAVIVVGRPLDLLARDVIGDRMTLRRALRRLIGTPQLRGDLGDGDLAGVQRRRRLLDRLGQGAEAMSAVVRRLRPWLVDQGRLHFGRQRRRETPQAFSRRFGKTRHGRFMSSQGRDGKSARPFHDCFVSPCAASNASRRSPTSRREKGPAGAFPDPSPPAASPAGRLLARSRPRRRRAVEPALLQRAENRRARWPAHQAIAIRSARRLRMTKGRPAIGPRRSGRSARAAGVA